MTAFKKALTIGVIILGSSLLMRTGAYANDICWKIQDKDQRYYCESIYEGKSNCWRIKNNDRRYLCESLKGKKSCWRIKDRDDQLACEAQTGQR